VAVEVLGAICADEANKFRDLATINGISISLHAPSLTLRTLPRLITTITVGTLPLSLSSSHRTPSWPREETRECPEEATSAYWIEQYSRCSEMTTSSSASLPYSGGITTKDSAIPLKIAGDYEERLATLSSFHRCAFPSRYLEYPRGITQRPDYIAMTGTNSQGGLRETVIIAGTFEATRGERRVFAVVFGVSRGDYIAS